MKKNITMALVALLAAGAAQANLLTNPNFDLDASGVQQTDLEVSYDWADVQAWEGSADTRVDRDDRDGEIHPTADMAASLGTAWNVAFNGSYIRQDSGVVALADTQYEFSIDLDSRACWNAALSFQTAKAGSWGAVGSVETAKFKPIANVWTTFSFVLDTAVNPEFVGQNIGVKVTTYDDDGGFLQATSASLEVISESESATLGLFIISSVAGE